MRLSEQLKVMEPTDRIRIIQGEHGNREPQFDPDVKILYCGFIGLIQYVDSETAFLAQDPEVVRMTAHMEIRHKQYKELGLFQPYEPEITRMYEFKDLTIFLYYDLYIKISNERTGGGNG